MSQTLGNYTIQGEIGQGGMAAVYKALQESLNRVVALKELDLARFRSEPNALERFRLEARAAAALEHPNIVTVYDLWEEDNKAYIAMEFVSGAELKDVLLSLGSIPYLNAVLIAMAISEALHYAHSKGMAHRDVKPGNIMLSDSGEIRLMDFGIVSVAGAGDLTVTGQILGTPAYMSPEQIAEEELGPGADLFSLGAVLYEMIAGRKPFSGTNHIALIQDVLHGEPIPLHELDPQVPESISRAVMKCIEKTPERRFGSMEEFSTVLEMVMPLETPSRPDVIKRLVVNTREQERTRLHSSAGEDDRTSPMVRTTGGGEKKPSLNTSAEKGEERSLIRDPGSSIYELEVGPSAELPPLEPDGSMTDSFEREPVVKSSPQTPLTMKDVPELDPEKDEGRYIEKTKKRKTGRPFLWILPIVLLAAGTAVWFFAGGSRQSEILKKVVTSPLKARITLVAGPAGSVFMDGELVGEANPSLTFDVKPGLHKLEVKNSRFVTRKFIVELEPGEFKEIEVRFGDQ
ncbi:MAG: serine/threonine-protein kinase [bacterium]|nr:serine/threonine-protein kinase [bacterium]MDT8366682.1 serine/threonine-protein kinase [bacterium]